MEKSPVKIDTLLEPLLEEASDDQADEALLELITTHAEPVIKGVIRYKLRVSSNRESQRTEIDDIYQEVVMQLVAQLRQFRSLPVAHPISDVRGMAAVIAHRTCSRWMRRQFPERHALKNRLHYLLTRQRGLGLWQNEDGRFVAGFGVWKEQNRAVMRLGESEQLLSEIHITKSSKHQSLADTAAMIFNHVGGPIEFDELVSAFALLLGIKDQPVESLTEHEESVGFILASGEPNPEWQLEKRMFLRRLWEELQELPLNQRTALLLNLKDASGSGCITLFPATGVATLRQLAEVLKIEADRFAQLWNDLPLEDARIAELLGITRQQVINARKSGRERLTRRLRGFL